MSMPKPGTILVTVLIAFGAIWIANNVSAVGKIVGPRGNAA